VIIDAQTGRLRRLTDQRWQELWRMTWLHDGSGVVFVAAQRGETNRQLWFASYPTGQVRRITHDLHNYGIFGLGISDDDSTIVTHQFTIAEKVWTADVNGGNLRPLTRGSGSDFVLGWATDERVMYQSDADALWTASERGDNPRSVPIDLKGIQELSPAPAGDWIAYVAVGNAGRNIWRVNLDGSQRRQLTYGGSDWLPNVSHDGAWVVYTRYLEDGSSVWRVPSAGGEPVRMTATSGFFGSYPSPDGQRILAEIFDEQTHRFRVAVLRFADGTMEQMLMDRPDERWKWSPDGRSVVYIRTEEQVSNLWAQPLSAGAPRQLTRFDRDRIFSFAYSADGQRLALSRGSVSGDVVLIRNFR
jgi:Tol biopolymer transport system component